ncbi:MAG: hypothetical protein IJ690_06980 [Clostridia bacterium]|nr:hypothetical protein [Clostridia bacterium]
MQSKVLSNQTLEQQIVELNKLLNEVKNIQKDEVDFLKINHITYMKKLEKLQEYNKIADMTNQLFEKRLSGIENAIIEINKTMST